MAKKKVRARKKLGLAGAPIDDSWMAFKQYTHYQIDSKEYVEMVKSYVKREYSKPQGEKILANPKWSYAVSGIASMCYWLTLENDFPDNYKHAKKVLNKKFKELIASGTEILKAKKIQVKKEASKFVITPQMRMTQKVVDNIFPDLYAIEDAWNARKKPGKYNLYKQLQIHDIKRFSEIEDWIIEHLNDYEQVVAKDEYMVESYSHLKLSDIKARIKLLKEFQDDLEKFKASKKAVRKIRTPKAKSADKQIEKLKYKAADNDFKLTSINPIRIPGSMNVYLFNTKNRQLTIYVSDNPDGVKVQGTTIKGFDKTLSKVLTLRKPGDIIPDVLKKSPKQIDKLLSTLKTKVNVPNGRVNDNMIILRSK